MLTCILMRGPRPIMLTCILMRGPRPIMLTCILMRGPRPIMLTCILMRGPRPIMLTWTYERAWTNYAHLYSYELNYLYSYERAWTYYYSIILCSLVLERVMLCILMRDLDQLCSQLYYREGLDQLLVFL